MRQLKKITFGALLFLWSGLGATVQADVSKASDWLGRSVVTQDGEPLGRVEDMAIDIESASIAFMVISVGSFLIDDALIAVDPDALGPSADGKYLVLNSDGLQQARRFNAASWPAAADVLPVLSEDPAPFVDESAAPAQTETGVGRAFISDGRRQATFADGERKIEPVQRSALPAPRNAVAELTRGSPDAAAVAAVDAGAEPLPSFERIDSNRDLALDRNEFGAYLGLKERYQDIDVDGNGRLDRFEFDLLKENRAKQR